MNYFEYFCYEMLSNEIDLSNRNYNVMENLLVKRYMRLIEPLPFEIKLELISKIFENLKTKINPVEINKESLLNELYGSWEDINDSITEEILSSRTISEREINLD